MMKYSIRDYFAYARLLQNTTAISIVKQLVFNRADYTPVFLLDSIVPWLRMLCREFGNFVLQLRDFSLRQRVGEPECNEL